MFDKQKYLRPTLLALSLSGALTLVACGGDDDAAAVALPKNVIVMISDGASYNAWEMAANWQKGVKANDLDEYKSLPVRLGMTTFPLNTSNTPTNTASAVVSYDAAKAWNTTLGASEALAANGNDFTTAIEAYKYLRASANITDSAAAATALASGQKTYNNAINYDNFGKPVEFITQLAKKQGKATGVVTSVELSHATPAGFGAQNLSRNNYAAIAQDMFAKGNLDLIMGAGHPEFDDNGNSYATPSLTPAACDADATCAKRYQYVGGAVNWAALKNGSLKPTHSTASWKLVQNKADFDDLASGRISISGPLAGIPQVYTTLQQARQATVLGADSAQPSGAKLIATVPTLETMTKGALNHLGKNQKGLFLMIEGGAVDWAAHANQAGRIVEEQVDFNRTVAAVQAWVEKNSNWNETLLIVTTDHGNALPLGMGSDKNAFEKIINKGANMLPDVRFWTGNHTNELVRLWARGQGSDKLNAFAGKKDAKFAEIVGHNTDGSYLDNTDIFKTVKAALGL